MIPTDTVTPTPTTESQRIGARFSRKLFRSRFHEASNSSAREKDQHLIASGAAMITKWVPVPYTVALVVVGLVTSQMHFLPTIHISPELILINAVIVRCVSCILMIA